MVQVIMPQTKRMSAFDEAMSNSGDAISDFGVALFQKKEDETKRQQALQMDAAKILMSQDLEVNPESISKLTSMLGTNSQPKNFFGFGGGQSEPAVPAAQPTTQDKIAEYFSGAAQSAASPGAAYDQSGNIISAPQGQIQMPQATQPVQGGIGAVMSQPAMQQAVQPQEGINASGFKYNPKKLAEIAKEKNQAMLGQLQLEKEQYDARQRSLPLGERDEFRKTALTDSYKKSQDKKEPMKALNATQQSNAASIVSAFQSLGKMKKMIDEGYEPKYITQNTKGIGEFIESDPFTVEKTMVNEAIGRIQSQGAITDDEISTFNKMGPTAADRKNPEIMRYKIDQQVNFIKNKLTAMGLKEEDLVSAGFNLGDSISQPGQATAPTATPQANIQNVSQDRHSEALNWAKNNPNDPRALKIMQAHQVTK